MIDTKDAMEVSAPELLEAARVAADGQRRRRPWARWLAAVTIAAAVVGGGIGATVSLTRSETASPVLDRQADYGFRHPAASLSESVGAATDSDLRGDYGLRHPVLLETVIDRTGDYGLRHPGS